MSAYSNAHGLPPWAANMAAHMAAFGPNMATALPAIGPNMAAHMAALGPNMAGALPAIGPNMAAHMAGIGPNMAGALPAIAANMAALGGNMAAHVPQTGAGGASGTGFLGGYGPIARLEYATPASLGPIPWAMDFTYEDGWGPFQFDEWTDPTQFETRPSFSIQDWDPALRFWTLKFDPELTEWLQDVNLAAPSIMAAREYAKQQEKWICTAGPDDDPKNGSALQSCLGFGRDRVLEWNDPNVSTARQAWTRDITALQDLMRDDRERYIWEAQAQSQGVGWFFTQFIAMDPAAKPWTLEWLNCAAAISNLTKMHYKAHYKRLRPSVLCPGLVPPWGPPMHPAFPSGHSLVAHMMALFLLEIPYLATRFGVKQTENGPRRKPRWGDFMKSAYGQEMSCPLLWLAWRMARNRERIGVHYATDSAASRLLAAGLAHMLFGDARENESTEPPPVKAGSLDLPSLNAVLAKARAEWPQPWGADSQISPSNPRPAKPRKKAN